MTDYTEIDGLKFKYREGSRDLIILDQVVRHNAYHLPDNMIGWQVIDVGGHIGSVALMAAKRGAEVVTFEPTDDSFSLLSDNIDLNYYMASISGYNLGVGVAGLRKLYHYQNNETEANSLFPNLYEYMTTDFEEMVTISLESAIDYFAGFDTVDLLKLDCEGAEQEIIPEILGGLHTRIKRIAIEFHVSTAERLDLLAKLEQFYKVTALSHIEFFFTHKGDL